MVWLLSNYRATEVCLQQVCSYLFCSLYCRPYCDCYYPLLRWGLGSGFCSGANRFPQPASTNSKTNHAHHDDQYVPATYAMFEMGSRPACRILARVRENVTTKSPIPAAFDGLISRCRIPSSETGDRREDRGPKQHDPCDCCHRKPWESRYHGGVGGGGSLGPETTHIYY